MQTVRGRKGGELGINYTPEARVRASQEGESSLGLFTVAM